MDQAKAAVNKIIGKSGHHDTEVHETVNPAVTSETIKPHRHEETTQAVDREVHQDHYHTTVQPLQHKEVLPEQHKHQTLPVQEREISHGDHNKIKSSIESEAAKFTNTSTTHQTTHSTSQAPVAAGEHVHHHVHETVQPVIHKQTVQPEVVHTVQPIHETHHAQAEHHGLSTLPTKTLSEFKELGGKITGQSHRHEEYEGHPRPYNPSMQETRNAVDTDPKAHDGLHGSHGSSGITGGLTGSSGTHTGTTGGLTGTSGTHTGTTGGLTGTSGTHTGTTGGLTGTSGTHHTGTTGGLSGTHGSNVSGSGVDYSTGPGLTSGGVGSTGTALGGRTEGNTASRALDAATSHSSTGHTGTTGTSGIGTHDSSSRGLDTSTGGYSSTGGITSHSHNDRADTSSSTRTGTTGTVKDDVQTPSQGRDPNLVEDISTKSHHGLTGQGADGSHSAVFGLTPDGHTHDDTSHITTALKPAFSKDKDGDGATGDIGSRAPVGSGVADQMRDLKVSEGAHGYDTPNTGSAKIGAGAIGGSQGFGNVRPNEHGTTAKIENKFDPTTDADGDGKRGVLD